MAIVAFINVILLALSPLANLDPEKLPAAHSWIWWTAQDFLKQDQPPDLVLLGSSLLVHPICQQEADYLKRNIDNVVSHRSRYLESQLSLKSNMDPPLVFNFAVPGSLMSDNYMVLRSLFGVRSKPRVIVLGLALRDFIDNEVTCAAATPAFKYLQRYFDVFDLVDLAMPKVWQRLEFWLNRGIYMLGKKLDAQSALSQYAERNWRPGLERGFYPCRLNDFDMSCYVPSLRSEIERNVWISRPGTHQPCQDNSPEYLRRYRSPNLSLFQCQRAFLYKFLERAEAIDIKVLLVNLPLTKEHFALMPPGAYPRYMSMLNEARQRFHTPFLDCSARDIFCRADFVDTCHMQASGGKKLLDLIASEIRRDQCLSSKLGIFHKQSADIY